MTAKACVILTLLVFSLPFLTGCATWSTGSVDQGNQQAPQVYSPTQPEKIVVTEGDVPDRASVVLGDVHVTVNKTTALHADPTRNHVNEALQEKAAGIGADAVTHVKYSDVSMGLMSWGSMDGDGRAIKFTE